MQDDELIALYFSRSETAIAETKQQYGTYCYSIAYHILPHPEDAEECENDTYWKAWNAIPPTRPRHLKSFLGKITRNIALHVWEHQHAEKRGGTTMALVLEELSECIPSEEDVEQAVENFELRTHLNRFLADLPKETRMIFIIVSILVYRLKCFCILNCYQNKPQKAHVLAESFSVGAWAFCRFIVYGNVMSRFVRIAIHAECFPLKGIHSVQWCGLHTVRIVVCADHIVLAAWCSCGRQRLVSGGCRHGLQYQIHHI